MLLDDQVDARQRTAEEDIEHVDEVRPLDEGHVHRRHDQHQVAVGHPELAPDRRPLRDTIPAGGRGRIEVEPWRP